MNKWLNILDYALISLLRRRRKQIALVVVYTLVVAFFASVIFFTGALRQEAVYILSDLPELWVQQLAGGRLVPVAQSKIDSIASIRGVKRVISRLWGYYYDSPSGAVFTIIGSDSMPEGLKLLDAAIDGRLDGNQVLCGSGFPETHFTGLGEQLGLIDFKGRLHSFEIVGRFLSQSDLLTRDLIILSSSSARKILGMAKNKYTDLAVEVWNPDEAETVGRKIDRMFPSVRVVTSVQLRSTYETLFSHRGGIFIYGALISLFAFLILAWDRASGLSREERQELGILKGIGWQIGDVLWMKFWEGAVISLTSTICGLILAYLHVFFLNAPLLRPFLIGWSVLYPEYKLQPAFGFSEVFLIVMLAVVPFIAATIIPAWRGSVTEPAEVMQNG